MRKLTFVLFLGSCAWAQNPSVPATYQSLFTSLEGNLSTFATGVTARTGTVGSTLWSTDLLLANANSGLQLLRSGYFDTYVIPELDRDQSLGLKAVTVTMGFPVVTPDFYAFNGDSADFTAMLQFYTNVSQAIHQRGMKMVVESAVLFPGFFSENSGFNLSGYFATLSDAQFVAQRVQNLLNVAKVQPDYINLNSEPTTDLQLTNRPGLYGSPDAFASLNDTIVTQLKAQGVTIPLGSGVGNWEQKGNAQPWVTALVRSKIDYFDIHIYNANFDYLQQAATYIAMAQQAGKRVACSESWLEKISDGDINSSGGVSALTTFYARDTFSFWAPLDEQFINTLFKFAMANNMIYASPFWSRYFWTYLDYNQAQSMTPEDTIHAAIKASIAAMLGNQVTSTALTYSADIKAEAAGVTTASAADYLGPVAPDSIVSLFAANIATQVTGAPKPPPAPLPTSLGGVSATITDISGNTAPMSLIVVAQRQVNAVLPSGLQAGPAVINLTTSSGVQLPGNVIVAPVAPALFTADESGKGTAAAQVLIAHADGSRTSKPDIATCTSSGCTPVPINLGSSTDQAYLILFGTGIRGAAAGSTTVRVGNTAGQVSFAGAQGQFFGLDQVNVLLPHSLAGSGTVNVVLAVAGKAANTVTVDIQ